MNKKAGERILIVYWVAIFMIISIGIVSSVIIFYSVPFDIRGVESGILVDKVINCFVEDGKISSDFESVSENNFLETCGLNFEDKTGKYEDGQFYADFEIAGKKVLGGNFNLEAYCGAERSKKNIPYCTEKKLFILDKSTNAFI